MAEFYVEVGVWVEAEDTEDAKREVADALRFNPATESYDILAVSPSNA